MIKEWHGCRSCGKSVTCKKRHDSLEQAIMNEKDNCDDREYINNVMRRSTFR